MMASNVSSISEELLADSYLLSSVLFVNPEKMEKESTDDRIQNLCLNLKEVGLDDIATQFEKFHAKLWEISEEEHLFALEMTPSLTSGFGRKLSRAKRLPMTTQSTALSIDSNSSRA